MKNIFARKEKKELTQKQQTVRTVLNWVASIACIIVIVFALVVAIFTISSTTNERHLMQFGDTIYMNVASDSMAPTFDKSDMIICDLFNAEEDNDKLVKGQVITFEANIAGYLAFNTHRIVDVEYAADGTVLRVRTRGDNQDGDWKTSTESDGSWDSGSVAVDKIVSTWGSVDEDGNFTSGKMLKGVGAFSNWIQDVEHPGKDSSAKVRFFCVVVLPLILLFVIYAFILIRTLVIAKLENNKPVESENAVTVDSLSDEEKRRLAEEYLAKMALEKAQQEAVAQSSNAQEPAQDAPQEDSNN